MSNKAAAVSTQSGRTTILWGGPGIGKTTIFEQFFDEPRGYHMEVMPVAVQEHSDVGGMPFLSKEDIMNACRNRIGFKPCGLRTIGA
jgi:replication-associated recombination protein RarA